MPKPTFLITVITLYVYYTKCLFMDAFFRLLLWKRLLKERLCITIDYTIDTILYT